MDFATRALERLAVEVPLRSGRALYYKGDPADRCWALIEGRVRLLKPRSDGSALAIGEFGPPAWLGLAEAWLGLPYAADAVAVGDCRLRRLGRANLAEAARDPGVAAEAIGALARGLYDAFDLFDAESAVERVARAVAALAPPIEGTARIEVTQAALAEAAGVTRETANKCLARLEREGFLETGRGILLVYDRASLVGYEE
jgi:CRP-like cAMP-binding protein